MKVLLLAFSVILISATSSAEDELKCSSIASEIPNDWVNMADGCLASMRHQIQMELTAAMTYLALGAHFSQDIINRPGFSEFFFKTAREAREDAIKIMSYLLMRGELTGDISNLIDNPSFHHITLETRTSSNEVFKKALNLKSEKTQNIINIKAVCQNSPNNLVDYLTSDFLEEQLVGQRDLAGKVTTLDKMMKEHGVLGEFLFDKKLLGELV